MTKIDCRFFAFYLGRFEISNGCTNWLWKVKSLLFQLLPGICRALNTMGYTSYPKKAIILVICPLNALIESQMKELRQRSISCTCLSGNDADQDGTYNGDYSFVFANPEALFLNEKWRKMRQDFRTGPYFIMHTLLCFKKTIDVLRDCGALFFLFRGFFSKSIWT